MINERARRILDSPRDRLAHILPGLQVGGCYTLALTIAQELSKQYSHVLFVEEPLSTIDMDVITTTQLGGLDLIGVDQITPEVLLAHGCTGAILYNVTGHPGLGRTVPSIYYSYGVYDPASDCQITVPVSKYASAMGRFEPYALALDYEWAVPPLVQTKALRRCKPQPHAFTVGLFTSGSYDKYPCSFVLKLLGGLPAGTSLAISVLPPGKQYRHIGVDLAITERMNSYGSVTLCPIKPLAGLRYMIGSDVIVYASDARHYEPYGRMVVEAMAMGKPVICERKGIFGDVLEHGTNVLLYDHVGEVLDYIEQIRTDTKTAQKLGVNAQLWASWEDATLHIGKLKRILRTIGI